MRPLPPLRILAALCALAVLVTACRTGEETVGPGAATTVAPRPGPGATDGAPDLRRVEGVSSTAAFVGDDGLARWQQEVPGVADVRIRSSADGHEQPALWLPPRGHGPQPLLVVLHSWSYGYLQHAGIPFGRWAAQQGWAMVHPDFRGRFATAEATGSDLAVQDVVDAVDFALAEGDVDADRVFLIGFSGGRMMALLMAGRHPQRFAGVAAWVPIHDLVDWHAYNAERQTRYAREIRASCGGDADRDAEAREQCRHRSPRTHLDGARRARLPVYIGHGVDDTVVPPAHALRAFNQLADPADRFPDDAIAAAARSELADELRGRVDAEAYFDDEDPDVVLSRRSGAVTLVPFEGGHDMVYHPGLEWMVRSSGAWPT